MKTKNRRSKLKLKLKPKSRMLKRNVSRRQGKVTRKETRKATRQGKGKARISRKRNTSKSKPKRVLYGGLNPSFLNPPPHIEEPLQYGASNPSQEAFLRQQHLNENQQRLLNGEAPLHASEVMRGGASATNGIVVPQIQTSLAPLPNDANAISVDANASLSQQGANAVLDACVGQGASCTQSNLWDGKGGKKVGKGRKGEGEEKEEEEEVVRPKIQDNSNQIKSKTKNKKK